MVCHPGEGYWDYYPGTLFTDFIYRYQISSISAFQRLLTTQQGTSIVFPEMADRTCPIPAWYRPTTQIPQAHGTNIPQCTILEQKCAHAHFCYKMVYCGIFVQCIAGSVRQVYWPIAFRFLQSYLMSSWKIICCKWNMIPHENKAWWCIQASENQFIIL